MFAFLLTLLILDALLLSGVVLLQAGQGGGLASLGGATTDTVLGGRQAVTLLTKATWWTGGIFLVLALALSLVPRGGNDTSGLQERLRATTPAPAPSVGGPTQRYAAFEQFYSVICGEGVALRRLQAGRRASSGAHQSRTFPAASYCRPASSKPCDISWPTVAPMPP